MIKVNLLKTKVQTTTYSDEDNETNAFTGFEDVEGGPVVDKQDAGVKLIIIVLIVLSVVGYELYVKGNLDDQLILVQKESQKQSKELAGLDNKVGDSTVIKKEINEIKEKIDIINDLSKKRLRELKALDYLQSFIPDGLWLSNLDYNGRDIDIEGFSVSEKDLETFVVGLEKSPHFIKVERISSITQSSNKSKISRFTLTSQIGDSD